MIIDNKVKNALNIEQNLLHRNDCILFAVQHYSVHSRLLVNYQYLKLELTLLHMHIKTRFNQKV